MKTKIQIIALFVGLIAAAPAKETIPDSDFVPTKEIVAKLSASVRGAVPVARTGEFSSKGYQQLNRGLDPKDRGIRIVANGGQEEATVNTDPTAQASFGGIHFKLNSIELADRESARQLLALAEALKEIGKGYAFVIEGHTCDLGTDRHNLSLSERRARAVGLFLREKGVECELIPLGYGEKDPVNSNASESQRQANRRVMIRRKA